MATYAAFSKEKRHGIGLCLSGGGYRATLFHLGALQRLHELGVLEQVTTVTSVSGGSITAGHLATVLARLNKPIGQISPQDWRTEVTEPLEAFTRKDIRTGAIFRRLLPWNWARTATGVEALAARYRELIPGALVEIPAAPRFIFCATDIAWGVSWTFERGKIGDYQAGYVVTPPEWPLARTVAASSCFPPVFNPLPVGIDPARLTGGKAPHGPGRDACIRDLRLSDGGVYDNLGLEPVWRDHAVVLVSDGGALFNAQVDEGLLWRLGRYVAIQGNQAHALRTRWLVANFLSNEMDGTYWSVGGACSSYEMEGGYSKELATEMIAEIRTDLDGFSETEAAILENHGYLLTDAALRRHVPSLVAKPCPPPAPPYPKWLLPSVTERQIREALKNSGKRKVFGRG